MQIMYVSTQYQIMYVIQNKWTDTQNKRKNK